MGHGRVTEKQEAFSKEFIANGGNASAAHIKAYPSSANWSGTGAAVAAHKMLKNPKVLLKIRELREEIQERSPEINSDYLLRTLKRNIDRALEAVQVRDRSGTPIEGQYTWNGAIVLKSVELIARILGIIKDRREISGPDGGPIPVAVYTVMDLVREAQTYIDAEGYEVLEDEDQKELDG